MFLRKLYRLHERIKSDWRFLALVASLIIATLTTILFLSLPSLLTGDLSGIMSVLAGLLTSIVATTFSFVFVALQLASVQFSPRIIRSFFAYDQFSRFFLWSFLACVGYLMGLQYFGLASASRIYAHFGVVGSFYLILLVFPLFIHHVIDNINASSITRSIANRTIDEIDTLYDHAEPVPPTSDLIHIYAPESGYFESIRYKALASLFPDNSEVRMVVRPRIGTFVLKGSVIAEIHCPASKQAEFKRRVNEIEACFLFDKFRSYKQDVPFGIRQLVDIAIKAISPAVNDPTTALNCLDYLGVVIQKAALSDTISREAKLLAEKNIYIREFNFDQLVDLAFDQIYKWGQEDYIVVRHIIRTITHVIPFAYTPEKISVLTRQVEDMELQYLHAEPEVFRTNYLNTTPFSRREHRNSLRDYLDHYYKAVILQIERLQLPDDSLLAKMEQYRRYRREIHTCKE